jgi:hypothetical protein
MLSRPQAGETIGANSTYELIWSPSMFGNPIGIEIWNEELLQINLYFHKPDCSDKVVPGSCDRSLRGTFLPEVFSGTYQQMFQQVRCITSTCIFQVPRLFGAIRIILE